jgi:DNA (cytosine-5)-methyltransferase 1
MCGIIIVGYYMITEVVPLARSYNKLWKLMIDKKINKTQLCKAAGITTNAMAKLGRDESVPLETLEKICETLDCNIEDVVEITSDQGE